MELEEMGECGDGAGVVVIGLGSGVMSVVLWVLG